MSVVPQPGLYVDGSSRPRGQDGSCREGDFPFGGGFGIQKFPQVFAQRFHEERLPEVADVLVGLLRIQLGRHQQHLCIRVLNTKGLRDLSAPGDGQVEVEEQEVHRRGRALDEEVAPRGFTGADQYFVVQGGQLAPNQAAKSAKIADKKDDWAVFGEFFGGRTRQIGTRVLHKASIQESCVGTGEGMHVLANANHGLAHKSGSGNARKTL